MKSAATKTLLASCFVACGGGGGALVGVSDLRDRPEAMREDAAVDEALGRDLGGLALVSSTPVSRGHFLGLASIDVRTNDAGAVGIAEDRPYATGAHFLATHGQSDGKWLAAYSATKEAVDGGAVWAFAVRGDRTTSARCIECHREAPHDFIFTSVPPSADAGGR